MNKSNGMVKAQRKKNEYMVCRIKLYGFWGQKTWISLWTFQGVSITNFFQSCYIKQINFLAL